MVGEGGGGGGGGGGVERTKKSAEEKEAGKQGGEDGGTTWKKRASGERQEPGRQTLLSLVLLVGPSPAGHSTPCTHLGKMGAAVACLLFVSTSVTPVGPREAPCCWLKA